MCILMNAWLEWFGLSAQLILQERPHTLHCPAFIDTWGSGNLLNGTQLDLLWWKCPLWSVACCDCCFEQRSNVRKILIFPRLHFFLTAWTWMKALCCCCKRTIGILLHNLCWNQGKFSFCSAVTVFHKTYVNTGNVLTSDITILLYITKSSLHRIQTHCLVKRVLLMKSFFTLKKTI